MNKKIIDSINKLEIILDELKEGCADYRNAIIDKDFAKAQDAISVFSDCTEKYWFRLSLEPPIMDEDSLSEIFGNGVYDIEKQTKEKE
jgi:hypothetical protein